MNEMKRRCKDEWDKLLHSDVTDAWSHTETSLPLRRRSYTPLDQGAELDFHTAVSLVHL